MKGLWDWTADPRRVGRLKMAAIVLLALMVALDPLIARKSYVAVEETPSFAAIAGLGGVLAIVAGGLIWGLALRRRRYDDEFADPPGTAEASGGGDE